MKNNLILFKFIAKYIIGIALGVAGVALAIMLWAKFPFLAKLYVSRVIEVRWIIGFIIIGLFGFILANEAGWSENRRQSRGGKYMNVKLTDEQRKITKNFLDEAKEQKRTLEQWLKTDGKKLKELETFIGQPLISIEVVMDFYKQTLPKIDEEIKRLENELK